MKNFLIAAFAIATVLASVTAYNWYRNCQDVTAEYLQYRSDIRFEETLQREELTIEQKSALRSQRQAEKQQLFDN